MASPRRRRLKRLFRAGLLKAAKAVESVAESVLPEPVEAPVVEEAPKKEAPKKAKKAPKKK